MNTLVYGDSILDENTYCDVSRVSPEAPVLVANKEHSEYCLGGAANVLVNLHSIGHLVSYCSVYGSDKPGLKIGQLISELNVQDHSETSDTITSHKVRFGQEGSSFCDWIAREY